MADKIIFPIIIDDKECTVEIGQPFGAGGGSHVYFININKYYNGQLFKRSYGWDFGLARKSFLTTDDLDVIFDIIDGLAPVPFYK